MGRPIPLRAMQQLLRVVQAAWSANLPFRGVAVLVQCFQVAEHASELVPRHAKFFGVHDWLPL